MVYHAPRKKLTSLYMWGKAFDVYMCIWLKKQNNMSQQELIVTYANFIRNMQSDGLDFISYDHIYRQHCAAEKVKLSWSVIRQVLDNHFLVSKSKSNKIQQSKQHPSKSGSQNTQNNKQAGLKSFAYVPKGYCFQYHNKGKECLLKSECPFRHDCPNCLHAVHPAHSCRDKMSGWKSQASQTVQCTYQFMSGNAQQPFNTFTHPGQYQFLPQFLQWLCQSFVQPSPSFSNSSQSHPFGQQYKQSLLPKPTNTNTNK